MKTLSFSSTLVKLTILIYKQPYYLICQAIDENVVISKKSLRNLVNAIARDIFSMKVWGCHFPDCPEDAIGTNPSEREFEQDIMNKFYICVAKRHLLLMYFRYCGKSEKKIHKMNTKYLNIVGLFLGLFGVILIFIWGPPQPNLNEGVGLGLSDNTEIDSSGKTVKQQNDEVRRRRARHNILSRVGLGLIFLGFVFQIIAAWD